MLGCLRQFQLVKSLASSMLLSLAQLVMHGPLKGSVVQPDRIHAQGSNCAQAIIHVVDAVLLASKQQLQEFSRLMPGQGGPHLP